MSILPSVARTCLALATLGLVAGPVAAQDVDYNRAERFLSWHTSRMISGDRVSPSWLEDGRRFWYRNSLGEGHEFILVDPAGPARRQLFDHHRLAAAMSTADDTSYVGTKLPFDEFEFVEELRSIEFDARKRRFTCDIVQYSCMVGDTLPDDTPYVESPDGRWEAFVVEHDLWVRPVGGGDSVRLTTDGEEFWSYGLTYPRPNQVREKTPRRPSVRWSPDSRRLAVERTDERNVEHHHYVSMTPQRPVHYSYPYALPGDSVIPLPGIHVVTLTPPTVSDGNGDGGATALPQVAGNVALQFPERPLQSSFDGSVPDSAWSDDGS
ncbi:MAG TPA: DPP IV N-terminal domain-containing protein, partial [Longimicrobiales bacterium]|nr:DPP IV N-terminal domain-containing protein [Longimicrobiales bacterium]